MSGFLTARDGIRDFLRKYDEVTTPIIRFIVALVIFTSVNKMYGYSELFDRGIVIFLLSVISALVSDIVVVLVVGAVMCVNAFAISLEVGGLFLVAFILMYGLYMRMFPECSWILILVPVLYVFNLQFAVPLVVAIFVGLTGAVPAAFGVVLYYFSVFAGDVAETLKDPDKKEGFEPLTYVIKSLSHNKDMMVAIIVFGLVIVITNTIHRLSFDYSWYVAIAVGAICNVIFFIVCGSALDANIGAGAVLVGTIIGTIIAILIQICKSIADYSRKEVVQFEDDEYYYYVKAIPKLGVAAKNKNVKTVTSGESDGSAERKANARQMQAKRQQPQGQVARTQAPRDPQAQAARTQAPRDPQAQAAARQAQLQRQQAMARAQAAARQTQGRPDQDR